MKEVNYVNVIFDFDLAGLFVACHSRYGDVRVSPSPSNDFRGIEYYATNKSNQTGWEKYTAERTRLSPVREIYFIERLRRELYIAVPGEMYSPAQMYQSVTRLEPIIEHGKLNVYFRGYANGVGYPWSADAPAGHPKHLNFECYNQVIYSEDLPAWVQDLLGH